MATVFVQKRKGENSTSYRVMYYEQTSGRKKSYKTYRLKREAERAAHDLRSLIDSGHLPGESRKAFQALTFKEVAASLEEKWRDMRKTKELSQASLANYLVYIRQLNKVFGRRLLCKITERDIRSHRAELADAKSNATANRTLFVLKQIMKEGVERNAIREDVCANIRYLSEKEHERNRFLMAHELEALAAAAKKTQAKPYLPALIWLGAEHGASRQECLSLTWDDIDFDYDEQGLIRFFRTKNRRERTEFLMPNARAALLSWGEHLKVWRARKRIALPLSRQVFTRLDGTPIKEFKNGFNTACELAGITDFHFHDLRHTFCSNLLLAGGNLKDVKEMIGHADIKMTDRYSHLTAEHKRVLQDRLSSQYQAS